MVSGSGRARSCAFTRTSRRSLATFFAREAGFFFMMPNHEAEREYAARPAATSRLDINGKA
jgi:hypothetical protein